MVASQSSSSIVLKQCIVESVVLSQCASSIESSGLATIKRKQEKRKLQWTAEQSDMTGPVQDN
jgi:hypothetical protein